MSERERQPTRAAALRYQRGEDEAPVVVAAGQGAVAERILEVAREHGVPIHHDPALAAVLSRMDVDEQIPPELYVVVAEILAFLYRATMPPGRTSP